MSGAIVTRRPHQPRQVLPELADGALVADDHACTASRSSLREAAAVRTRGNDVRADVAERVEPPVLREGGEASEPASRDVLEKDTLDRILGAELEDLLESRLERLAHGRHRFTG